jgi:hypothetical protein
MKVKFFFFIALLLIGATSCIKTKYGNITFWQQIGSGYGVTTVTIDGISSNITSEYNSAPTCGESGCAVFNQLETGTYNYAATDGSAVWSGTVTIDEGCTTMELY